MASAAAPAVPTLAPPLEQLQHLAGELRLLLPGVRGELTQLGRATAGVGLGRERPGWVWGGGPGGGGGGRRWLRLSLLFLLPPPGTRCTHPVGEAQETTKEFNPETFWRRLSECLSCWVLPPLFFQRSDPFPLACYIPRRTSLRGHLRD